MTAEPESHELTEEEQTLFASLDSYVRALQAGDDETCSHLSNADARHTRVYDCLQALEALAPERPDRESDEAEQQQQAQAAEAIVGRYRLIEQVGRGGMGVVYRAEQVDLGRTVAVKMIRGNQLASSDEIGRFYAEARAAGKLHHPNIVRIHEVNKAGGLHFFAMEYIEGTSLDDYLGKPDRDMHHSVEMLIKVARAVEHLHENGIVHRDLKPSNILLDTDDHPYVTDFGLAKIYASDEGQTHSGTIIGTPGYMSPEQAAGLSSSVTPASDIYSLGAILYALLTGRPPFQRSTFFDTIRDVIDREPKKPQFYNAAVPRDLEHVCLRCLEKSPENRYASAGELADDLERFLKGEPLAAKPPSVWDRLRRWSRREPALASHLAAIGVVAAILQLNYMFRLDSLDFHLRVMGVLFSWMLASCLCHYVQKWEQLRRPMAYVWIASDVFHLTLVLRIAHSPIGPLLIGYPVMIVASAMFMRVRVVVVTTVLAAISFVALTLLRSDAPAAPIQYPAIFTASLGVLGFLAAWQVHRIRMLSRCWNPDDEP